MTPDRFKSLILGENTHIFTHKEQGGIIAFATTEKDAQRLRDLPQMPRELLERLFYFPISVDFLSERERELFTEKLTTL